MSLPIKLARGGELRRIAPAPGSRPLSFEGLCLEAETRFSLTPRGRGTLYLTFTDDEGDTVVITTDSELNEAHDLARATGQRSLRMRGTCERAA